MSKFISSLILLFLMLSHTAFGQDSLRSFQPSGIRVGVETIGLIKSFTGAKAGGKELFADIDFGRYLVAVEAGESFRNLTIKDGTYSNEGKYLRLGVDVNFLKKDPDRNMFFLGFRYGRAVYGEKLDYLYNTGIGAVNMDVEQKQLKSGWLELTTGLRVRVVKFFWMGYTARLKFGSSVPDESPIAPYEIPGYGLTFKKPWWGFSYYLMFRIPFKKDQGSGLAKK